MTVRVKTTTLNKRLDAIQTKLGHSPNGLMATRLPGTDLLSKLNTMAHRLLQNIKYAYFHFVILIVLLIIVSQVGCIMLCYPPLGCQI